MNAAIEEHRCHLKTVSAPECNGYAAHAMDEIVVPAGPPSDAALDELARRCKGALERLRSTESEVRLPLVMEFSGSPKSGKTTIIGIVAHFLKRMGATVIPPVEGASLRTPPGLRDDWLTFNAWSGCYALQQILVDCSLNNRARLRATFKCILYRHL